MCTTALGTVYKESDNLDDSGDYVQTIDAKSSFIDDKSGFIDTESGFIDSKSGFNTDRKMWKVNDFRCLKPKEDVNPEDWPHYEMHGYRAAKNKEELENVKEIAFDKYFFNLEDPRIFMEMMKGAKRKEIWKSTYGFDYVAFNDKKKARVANYKCYKYCLIAEHKQFARKCRRNGGQFKCCMST